MSPSRGENPHVLASFGTLYEFYSGSDDPWFPPGVIQPAQSLPHSHSSAYAYNTASRGFQDFRSAPAPSDCDTALDSGYGGSRTTYSAIESVASFNDNDGYTESRFLDPQTANQLMGMGNLNLTSEGAPMYKTQVMASSPAKLHHCDYCGANVKTKSELRKHHYRHNRPYKCDYEKCPKAIQGFSTTNDLSRHKRTVHREHDNNGPIFICRHEPCIHKKEKLWPRADNFRSHLIRAHNITLKADDDLRNYRYHPIPTKPREFGISTAGIRSELRSALHPHTTLYTNRHSDCSQGKEIGWPNTDGLQGHSAHIHDVGGGGGDDDLGGHRDQPDEAELHALRGVGSSVADVDPESRPTQVQDSPDLRSSQLPVGALSRLQSASPEQNHLLLTQSKCDSQLAPSNTLDGLNLVSALGPQPLANDAVGRTPVREDSLEESMAALPDDEPAQEILDQEESDPIESGDELLDHHDPLAIDTMSLGLSSHSKGVALQTGIHESQDTDNDQDHVSRASTKASTSPSTTTTVKLLESFLANKDASFELLSLLKTFPKDLLVEALKHEDQQSQNENAVPSDPAGSPKMPLRCTKCHKPFSRACELRKHMKRHEKPYGCTYKTCHKMFGSKNDWKRHESSQHFQMESWNCDYKDCDKVLPRRELFKTHLQHDHQETDSLVIENKLESCRLGRHCDPRFWCGFCNKFIEIKEKVVNSWTKRCDHIDNHLFGKDNEKKTTMADWRYLEEKLEKEDSEAVKKPETVVPSSRPVKKRKATDDLDMRSAKKRNVLWTCCACNHPENYQISSQCMEIPCGHKLCGNCKVEQLPDFEHEADLMSQEEAD